MKTLKDYNNHLFIFILLLSILLFFIGCKKNNKNKDKEYLTKEEILNIIKMDTLNNNLFTLSQFEKQQLELLAYLEKKHFFLSAIRLDYTDDLYSEELYNAKLFFNNINYSFSNLKINYINYYEDSIIENLNFIYFFKNSKLSKIISLEDTKQRMNFKYNNGLLKNVYKYNKSQISKWYIGNRVEYKGGNYFNETLSINYNNKKLCKSKYYEIIRPSDLRNFKSSEKQKITYYNDKNDINKKYIKIDIEPLNSIKDYKKIICFENGKLKYIVFFIEKDKYMFDHSLNPSNYDIKELLLFSHSNNNIKIKDYYNYSDNNDKNKINQKFKLTGDKYIIINYSFYKNYFIVNKITDRFKEYYYQYEFVNKNLIGYNIFRKEIQYFKKESERKDEPYKIDSRFRIVE